MKDMKRAKKKEETQEEENKISDGKKLNKVE